MELEKQAHRIDDIRGELESRLHTRLRVKANLGRAKYIEAVGELIQTHPALFVMEVDRKRGRTARQSYQYVDVLTGTVELFDPDTEEPVFIFIEPEEFGTDSFVDLLINDNEFSDGFDMALDKMAASEREEEMLASDAKPPASPFIKGDEELIG